MEQSGATSITGTIASVAPTESTTLPPPHRRWGITLGNWSGFVPFLLFCLLFEVLPTVIVVETSFLDSNTGALTLNNYQRMLSQASNLHAFQNSISLALVVALINTVVGFFAAYGLYNVRIKWVQDIVTAFSSIATNFAGIPLALAFIFTLGVQGYITQALLHWFHVNLYHGLHFSLYTFWGLVMAYSYFEVPLMILVTLPAIHALRPQWQEAATSLGASGFTYWRRIALPILLPSIISGAMLLFANAFAAFATAYALAQGEVNLVTILISFVVNGNVNMDYGLGNALAVGMIVVLFIAFLLYTAMFRRVSRWQGR